MKKKPVIFFQVLKTEPGYYLKIKAPPFFQSPQLSFDITNYLLQLINFIFSEYEATLMNFGDNNRVQIHFIGMDIDQDMHLTELKSSHGEEARKDQRNKFQLSKSPKKKEWEVGMPCRALFVEDGAEYEGEILNIDSTEDGDKYVIVRFVGYGNEESIWLDDVLPSAGPEAAQRQIQEMNGEIAADDQITPAEEPIQEVKVENPPIVEDAPAVQLAPAEPEQKAVDWKIGMFCRAIFSEDGLEYEGEIKEMNFSDEHQYAMVEFLGYGNQEPVWTDQLMDSAGAKARKAQIDEALAGASEDAPVEKMEETVALAPKEPVIITETNVKTPVAVEKPKTVNEEPVIKGKNMLSKSMTTMLEVITQLCNYLYLYVKKQNYVKSKFKNS